MRFIFSIKKELQYIDGVFTAKGPISRKEVA
jgi:hypothetical protein